MTIDDLQKPGTRKFDLVLCDIDGCLVAETTAPFDLPSLSAIAAHNRAAQEQFDRPVLTPCTGRPQPFAEAICRLTANRTVPAICENGVWLYHPGPNIYSMDPSIEEPHLRVVPELQAWLLSEFGPKGRERRGRGIALQPGKAASVSIYHPEVEYVRELMPRLREILAERMPMFRVSMTGFYINCDLKHISKGTAIDWLLSMVKLPRERIAGIGDMPSDLPIRERVGFFACPSNADASVKAVADYVSPHEQAIGVLDILERV